MNIVWTTAARAELRAMRKFIARDSAFYADRMVARIIERVEKTALSPTTGHRVHEYPEEELREVHESPYRILYAFDTDTLHVITLVHFRQQLGSKAPRP